MKEENRKLQKRREYMSEYNRMKNEDENAYIWRVCEHKDEIGTWQDVCDLLNQQLGHEYNESWYRKMYQSFMALFSVVKDKYFKDDYVKLIDEKIVELEKARVKYRDERTHHNRNIRGEARLENKLDYLEKVIKSATPINYVVHPKIDSDNDLLVMLSDLHVGQTFASAWGRFNADIAKDRMSKYLDEILNIQKRHNSENCYISLQGDLISNSIHKTLAISNSENVIEQIILVSELIADFINKLSINFNNIFINSVVGNHSRIDTKEDAVKDERLDTLIEWYLKAKLINLTNVSFIEPLDNTLNVFFIRDKSYVSVHGDYDKFDKTGVANLMMMLGFVPYCVLFGHKHFPATTEINGVKLVQSGSLPGSGDDYTIQMRLCGKPSQTVLVCNEDGIYANYNVEFKD